MNSSLDQVLSDQNLHWGGKPYKHGYDRLHNKPAIKDLEFEEIQIITGIRRSGKSTLMHELINELSRLNRSKSILYLNLDDPNYTEIWGDPSKLYQVLTAAEKLTGETIEYLLLDEVQNIIAWEQYVKSVYDSKKFKKIIVTGSNADLLNSDYATLLTGRYVKTHVYPLSYKELLLNNNISNQLEFTQQKGKALKLLEQMLESGGFPRIATEKDAGKRIRLLKIYYETILLKDCVNNHKIRDTRTLMSLSHYLLSNISSCYSYNSLSRALGSNENTMQEFVQIFQNAYFLSELRQFSYSLKTHGKSKKKIYSIDNGLINAATYKFSHDYGKLLENLVYSELVKNGYENISFYNEAKECDFIAFKGKEKVAIQSCYEFTSDNQAREVDGLKAAMGKFSISKGVVLTYDQEEQISDSISIVPFWRFFGFSNM